MNVVLHDLDLNVEGKKFESLIFLKNALDNIYKFCYCYRKSASLRIMFFVTFTYIFKVKYWNVNISKTVRASAEMRDIIFIDFILHDLDLDFEDFSRLQFYKFETPMSLKRWQRTQKYDMRWLGIRVYDMNLIDSDICHRMTSLLHHLDPNFEVTHYKCKILENGEKKCNKVWWWHL